MALAPRLASFLVPLVGLVLAGCPDSGGGPTTTIVTGGATTGVTGEGGLDEGGSAEDCFAYLDACELDPYCRCFTSCASDGGGADSCLAQCGLAEIPYWAQLFLDCIGSQAEPDPDPPLPPQTSGSTAGPTGGDPGDPTGGDPSDTTETG